MISVLVTNRNELQERIDLLKHVQQEDAEKARAELAERHSQEEQVGLLNSFQSTLNPQQLN